MQVGSFTSPVKFASPQFPAGRWYIFKLQEKRLQTENLTLESQFPDGDSVRHRITVALTNQRKEILNAALIEVALTEAKVVNNLAANILNNPSNLGLRPASTEASKPASSPSSTTAPSASPAAKASSSPSKAASPAKRWSACWRPRSGCGAFCKGRIWPVITQLIVSLDQLSV